MGAGRACAAASGGGPTPRHRRSRRSSRGGGSAAAHRRGLWRWSARDHPCHCPARVGDHPAGQPAGGQGWGRVGAAAAPPCRCRVGGAPRCSTRWGLRLLPCAEAGARAGVVAHGSPNADKLPPCTTRTALGTSAASPQTHVLASRSHASQPCACIQYLDCLPRKRCKSTQAPAAPGCRLHTSAIGSPLPIMGTHAPINACPLLQKRCKITEAVAPSCHWLTSAHAPTLPPMLLQKRCKFTQGGCTWLPFAHLCPRSLRCCCCRSAASSQRRRRRRRASPTCGCTGAAPRTRVRE